MSKLAVLEPDTMVEHKTWPGTMKVVKQLGNMVAVDDGEGEVRVRRKDLRPASGQIPGTYAIRITTPD